VCEKTREHVHVVGEEMDDSHSGICNEPNRSIYEDEPTLPSVTEISELTLPSASDSEDTLPSASDDSEDDRDVTLLSASDNNLTFLSGTFEVEFSQENRSSGSHPFVHSDTTAEIEVPLMSSTPRKALSAVHTSVPEPEKYSESEEAVTELELIVNLTSGDWQISKIENMNGCGPQCALKIHGLTNHDILRAHSHFTNRTLKEQNTWVIQYLADNCPYNVEGEQDVKGLAYTVQGKSVCQKLWLEILSLSSSRFYRLRQYFLKFGGITISSNSRRSLSSKTLEAIAWMEDYFERVGDKRPDKANAIYLPTCLTEKRLFEIFNDDANRGFTESINTIGRSQFNNLFKNRFKNVTIPKVSCESICTIVHCM